MSKPQGIDMAQTITSSAARAFAEQGVKFVGRYVKANSWKTIEPAEAQRIQAAGMQILSVFERTADRTKQGASAGTVDGIEAFKQAKKIGQPTGTAIYFAVDYDAPASQLDNIAAYLRAAQREITGYRLGVYGSYSVINAMAAKFPGIYLWQTRAWSKGKVSELAHVYQREIDVQANGHQIDWNDLLTLDAGLWPVRQQVSAPKPPEPSLAVKYPLVGVRYGKPKEGSYEIQWEGGQGIIKNNRVYVPLRQMAGFFGLPVGYVNKQPYVEVNAKRRYFSDVVLIDNVSYIQARAFAEGFSGSVTWDEGQRILKVQKGEVWVL